MAACLAVIALWSCGQAESATSTDAGHLGSPASLSTPEQGLAPASLHNGIDVSDHSGTVDWKAVLADGQQFALLKATEGVDLQDTAFADNWRAAKDAGIVRGAYHFYVTEDDPEQQAAFFIENVTLEPGDFAPVVDIETIGRNTSAGLPSRLETWLNLIEEHYEIKPIIYTSPNFWDQNFSAEFGEYPLWVAEYEVEKPRIPKGWKTWHLWQWQENATVPGVEKGADLNRVNHDGPDLSLLIIPSDK